MKSKPVRQTQLLAEVKQFEDVIDIASFLLQVPRKPTAVVFETHGKHLLQRLGHSRIYKYKK